MSDLSQNTEYVCPHCAAICPIDKQATHVYWHDEQLRKEAWRQQEMNDFRRMLQNANDLLSSTTNRVAHLEAMVNAFRTTLV